MCFQNLKPLGFDQFEYFQCHWLLDKLEHKQMSK